MKRKIIIIGSGPAAWSAAIYAARADLNPLVFTGYQKGGVRGGQLVLTTDVENYPGFPQGIFGAELVKLMELQARRFDTEVYEEDVLDVNLSIYPFIVEGSNTNVEAESIIVATGAYAKRLDVKGDTQFWGKGVSACAVCDGALPIFRNKIIGVVGGGDTACEESLFLTKYASRVYIILRKNSFRASKIMQDRIMNNPKIEVIYDYEVIEIFGDNIIKGVVLKHSKNETIKQLELGGLFYGIGHSPNVDFLKNKILLDNDDYIVVNSLSTKTSVDGVFAAGDVVDKVYKQAITAAGMGCMAALDAEKYLQGRE